ncbi:MAG TPA: hypothetical protein VGK73_11395 [Polyangiaceae bacterium]
MRRPDGAAQERDRSARDFPHGDRIRRALGVEQPLRASLDPQACAERGTPAITDGTGTRFADREPSLHVAAHEAAHQLQHAGVTRDGGLGAEGHAALVADTVVRGGSAAHLIGNAGERVPVASRNYQIGTWDEGRKVYLPFTPAAGSQKVHQSGHGADVRLGDLGSTLTLGSDWAFAEAGLITSANQALQARGSGIEMSAGTPVAAQRPDGATAQLPKIEVTTKSGQQLTNDCRQTALTVAGQPKKEAYAIARPEGQQAEELQPGSPEPFQALLLLYFIQRELTNTSKATGVDFKSLPAEQQRGRIQTLHEQFEQKDKKALRSEFEADARDPNKLAALGIDPAQLGIDEFAQPGVGESYATIPTGKAAYGSFNFHFATVVMQSGSDSVTFEAREDRNGGKPFFQTYGRGPDSFHAEHQSGFQQRTSGGTLPAFTLPFRTQPPDAAKFRGMSTGALLQRHTQARAGTDERTHLEAELRKRNVRVEVKVVTPRESSGDDSVYVGVFGRASTSTQTIGAGGSHVFEIPALKLLPALSRYLVEVFENDFNLFASDYDTDFIGDLAWAAPFAPLTAPVTISGSGATYQVKILP